MLWGPGSQTVQGVQALVQLTGGPCSPRGPVDSRKEHSGPKESASGMETLSCQDMAQGVPSWDLVGVPASPTQMQIL